MGVWVAIDCDLGLTLRHSGGYPGYGSHVLLLPEQGIGIFALANRTYAGPSVAVWDAAIALHKAGYFKSRSLPTSDDLASAYRVVGDIYQRGEVSPFSGQLAMNFLLDRDGAGWTRDLASLKQKLGNCDTTAPITSNSAMAGEFIWRCEHGRISGSVTLAPTKPWSIQEVKMTRRDP